MKPSRKKQAKAPVVDRLPPVAESPTAWIERLERSVRACRSTSVRVPKARVVKLCLLLRMIVRFVEEVDLENPEEARRHLGAFIEALPEQEMRAEQVRSAKGEATA